METPMAGVEVTGVKGPGVETNIAQEIDRADVKKQVQQLIALIKTSLEGDQLSPITQRELARLLSLTPQLDHRHTRQIDLLELAVSTLIEPDGNAQPGAPRKASKNLVFAQETRQQIIQQACPQPNLVKAIYKGEGSSYIRLISGLSWFFICFVIAPMLFLGTVFFVRELRAVNTPDKTIKALAKEKTFLEEKSKLQQQQIDILNNFKNSLSTQLVDTRNNINKQIDAIAPESIPSQLKSDLSQIVQAIDTELTTEGTTDAEQLAALTVQRKELEKLKVELGVNSSEGTATASAGATAQSEGLFGASDSNASQDAVTQRVEAETRLAKETAEGQTTVPLLFQTIPYNHAVVVVIMGAMGSTVSVIVRANTFISQAHESDNDLFLTGFFRPLVGMSFAIFCVALLEAGIFSGFFDLAKRDDDQIYLYIAIAFVAGFSERLVSDVVGKTEDTLAGPSSRQ